MHKLGEIAEDAQEIAEAAAEIAEDAAEEAIETSEEVPPAAIGNDAAGAIHDVSIEERLSDCLQRLAVVEERLTQQSIASAEATIEAQTAQDQAELATGLALESLAEPEVSSDVIEVEPEVSPKPPEKPRHHWLAEFLALP